MADRGTWGFKGSGRRALEFPNGEDVEVSPENRGRIRYNDAAKRFESSVDGEDYLPLTPGSAAAAAEPDWYIDPVSGDDSNSGTDPAEPLKTHEEIRQRIGRQPISVEVTIHLADDLDEDNPIFCDFTVAATGSIRYVGEKTLTTLYSGSFTAVTPLSRSGNEATLVADASLPVSWDASGLLTSTFSATRRIRITGGNPSNVGAVAYAVGEPVAKTARTTPFGFIETAIFGTDPHFRVLNNAGFPVPTASANYGAPDVGDTYVVETGFVQVSTFVISPLLSGDHAGFPGKFFVLVNDIDAGVTPGTSGESLVIDVGGNRTAAPTIYLSGCGVGSLTHWQGASGVDFSRLGTFRQPTNPRGGVLEIGACVSFTSFNVRPGAKTLLFVDSVHVGDNIEVEGSLVCANAALFDFSNSGGNLGGITGRPGSIITTDTFFGFAPQAAIYGVSSVPGVVGLQVQPGSQLVYNLVGGDASASLTVTGGAGDYRIATSAPAAWVGTTDSTDTTKLAGVSSL